MGSMPSTPAKATSNKRSADEQPVAHQPPVRRRRTDDLPTSPQQALVQLQPPPNPALQSAQALASFSQTLQRRSQEAQDGTVSLSPEEVHQLSNNIEATVQSCESAASQVASRGITNRQLITPSPLQSYTNQRQRPICSSSSARSSAFSPFLRLRNRRSQIPPSPRLSTLLVVVDVLPPTNPLSTFRPTSSPSSSTSCGTCTPRSQTSSFGTRQAQARDGRSSIDLATSTELVSLPRVRRTELAARADFASVFSRQRLPTAIPRRAAHLRGKELSQAFQVPSS